MKQLIEINLSLGMNWENTNYIHEAIWNISHCFTQSEVYSYRISMVSIEMIENAMKYGDDTYKKNDAILFSLRGNTEEITIEVKNHSNENQESNINNLDSMIQWVRGYQNPYEAYIECLKRSSKHRKTESKLGIARMAYEGGALTDFYLDDKNRVAVSAIISLEN